MANVADNQPDQLEPTVCEQLGDHYWQSDGRCFYGCPVVQDWPGPDTLSNGFPEY